MRVLIQSDYEQCSLWAANYIVYRIKAFRPSADKPFVLGLPTGSTPLGTYRELIRQHKAGKVSFRNVVTFNMDEYIGLPPGSSAELPLFYGRKLFQTHRYPAAKHPPSQRHDPRLRRRMQTLRRTYPFLRQN